MTTTIIPRAVHPHSRGEHLGAALLDLAFPGSSPLARGAFRERRIQQPGKRFIPTHTGSISAAKRAPEHTPVHPHSRGEHVRLIYRFAGEDGSSPLARGASPDTRSSAARHRFIPTRAGSILVQRKPSTLGPVHPHSRGEHQGCAGWDDAINGSSPLARGACDESSRHFLCSGSSPLARGACCSLGCAGCHFGSSPLARGAFAPRGSLPVGIRFIPTRAGSMFMSETSSTSPSVHPHSRGEHTSPSRTDTKHSGSSPLARGALQGARKDKFIIRFIPTRAGSMISDRNEGWGTTVHPHSRGEHSSRPGKGNCRAGSSPLARGAWPIAFVDVDTERFIPTRAGSMPALVEKLRGLTVHPHSRGEHSRSSASLSASSGSSPLARGA